MTRRLLPVLLAGILALVSLPAHADVSMKTTVTIAGPTVVEMSSVTYLKGSKLRTDMKAGGQDMSLVVDLTTKEQLLLNHGTKEIQKFDSSAAMAALPVTIGEVTVSSKPTGEKREILGRSCQGYALRVSMPMTVGGETVTLVMDGPVWVTADGPEAAEYRRFYKEAAAAGINATPLAQGPQAKGLAEAQNALAALGIPLEQEMRLSMEGGGQMAAAMSQMQASMKTSVTDVSMAPIADAVFALPSGYTRKQERP